MGVIPFRLHLPADASPERRAAQARYEAATNTLRSTKSEASFNAANAEFAAAKTAYAAALLAEDKARRPEVYAAPPERPRPVSADLGLMITLAIKNRAIAIHDFDVDAAVVRELDHIEIVDVSDLTNLTVITYSGARFAVRITREG